MKKLVSVALAAAALAVPALATASGNGHRDKAPRTVEYVFAGVVSADASAVSMDLKDARGINKHARRSLAGASTVTIKLDAATRLKGRHGLKGAAVTLKAGDRVRVVIRAAKGVAAADLPAAKVVFDRGPAGTIEIKPVPAPEVTSPDPVVPQPVEPPVLEISATA
jgi:hypothetical protein